MRVPKKLFPIFCILLCAVKLQAVTITQANAVSCAIQSDGKILAAGTVTINNSSQFGIVRYSNNGTLDTTFNSAGIVTTAIGTGANGLGIALQSNGQSVVVGYTFLDGSTQIALARYNTDGSADSSFGSDGIVTTPISNGASGNAIAIDSSGNIVIAGSATISPTPQFFVARYSATDGNLDATFNNDGSYPGVALLPVGYRSKVNAIALQPADGKIVVAGYASYGNGDEFAVARFNTDGSLDTTFNSSGSQPGVITTQIGSIAQAQGVAIQSDGSIVVVGNSDGALCLVSYTSAGVLNTAFGTDGIVINDAIGNQSQGANAVAIDSSGNVVVTGYADNYLLVARYTSAGILDTSFNTNGYGLLLYEDVNVGNALQILTNGNILSVGSADSDLFVVAYTNSGSIDSSWGINGIITQPQGSLANTTEIWEQQSVGTNGGTFTAGSWQQRNLTNISTVGDAITLSNNRFTLAPGLYSLQITAPAYQVGSHQIRLQNVTNNTTALWGTSAFSSNNSGSQTSSGILAQLSVSLPTTFEIQHQCSITEANDGFGIATGFGDFEVYTTVRIVSQ